MSQQSEERSMKPLGNIYAHEKPSDLEVKRARLKECNPQDTNILDYTENLSIAQSTSQGLVLLFVTSGNTKGSPV